LEKLTLYSNLVNMFNKGKIVFDPTVERIYNQYIEKTMCSGMVDVKEFFQKVFENGYHEGYNDGQADAVNHGNMTVKKCRY